MHEQAKRRCLRKGADARPFRFPALVGAMLCVSIGAIGVPAHGQGYAARDVGAWTVSASSDGQGCFLTRTYQGPRETTVLLGLDVDGSNRLTVLNANWSVREKERLKLTFRFSKAAFPAHLAIGLAADGKRGFVSSFGSSFPATFAASGFLHITRGTVRVEELDLGGSGAAVAELRRCVDRIRGGASAGSARRDTSRIPTDPFADDSPRKSRK